MNKFIANGRLLRDVEILTVKNSDNVIGKTAIAIDRPYQKGKDKVSDIINLVIWGKTAEFASKFSGKGKMVAIVGRVQVGSYTNKEGATVKTFDVVVEEFQPLEWAKNDSKPRNDYADMEPVDNSQIPF